MNKCKVAVIGVGYLGQYHAEKFAQSSQAELVAVCDTDHARADEIAAKHQVQAVYDYHELLDLVDAVSIVVPTSWHHKVAKLFLEAGKHVLLEKPLTRSVEEANDLIHSAQAHQVLLQAGHLERFNPVVTALNSLIDNPRFIECVRVSPYKPRVMDINVILDVMIHDIDLILTWVKSPIKSISARGTKMLTQRIDFANARIEFENGCSANITASRISAKSQRDIRIFQDNAYIEADLQLKKLAIHHKKCSESSDTIMQEQSFEAGDSLRDECEAFLSSILNKTPVTVSAEAGRAAIITALDVTRIIAEQLAHEHTGTQAEQPWIQDA
jgi:predicted dehydrogenase